MLAAIIRLALRRSGLVLVLAAVSMVYGAYRLKTAGLDIFPEFAAKRVVIQTEAPGLSPEQVELAVTRPIERQLAGLLGLETIRSESLQGLSVVTLVFDEATDRYRARQTVIERLALVAGRLPPGAGPPVAVPLMSSSATVKTIGLTAADGDLMELRSLVDWMLVPRLLSVAGVADVNVFGGEVKQLQIQLQPERLARFGMTAGELVAAARSASALIGAGLVENDNQRIALQIAGLPDQAEALRQVVVKRGDGTNLRLGDVATVVAAPQVPISAASVNGQSGIVLMVIGQFGTNTATVSQAVEAELSRLTGYFAARGVTVHPDLFRPADYIERAIRSLGGHLSAGAAMVVAVLFLFLFNLRTALISALAIPLSLLGAAAVLIELGVNLNLMMLGGLTIALGEVVDDAIIDTENIFRRLRENAGAERPRSVFRVVLAASLEVRASVVFASFIIVLSFVPLLTLEGVAGRLFAPLGQAYILAILVSLLVAMTVTPALCFLFLGSGNLPPATPPLVRWLAPGYRRTVGALCQRSGTVLIVTAVTLAGGFLSMPRLGHDYLPRLREGHYMVHTSAQPGTALAESIRVGNLLTAAFRQVPGVVSISQWVGRAERGADTYGSHYSEYEVRLMPLDGAGQQRVLDRLREILAAFPGLRFEANTFLTERIDETLSGYTAPVVVNLFGDDLTRLDAAAARLAALMRSLDGAADVQTRSTSGLPLLEVRPNVERVAAFGLRPLDVAETVKLAFDGQVVGHFFERDRYHEIAVILPPDARRDPDDVARLPLRSGDGALIELAQAAEVEQIEGRYNILHRAGQRVQTVTCNVIGRDLGGFLAELRERVAAEPAISGQAIAEFTGAAVEQSVAKRELIAHALLAGVGILVLIYLALGSLRNTLLTLANLPFALVGGIAAAAFSGATLSVGSMLGFITLFGITVRNTIMLVSHYRQLVGREGQAWNLVTAVRGAADRLPAILMTALVTALAMLPIAANSDNPGREVMGPMAAIIIGGLVSSTLLNLLILPPLLWRFGRFDAQQSVVEKG